MANAIFLHPVDFILLQPDDWTDTFQLQTTSPHFNINEHGCPSTGTYTVSL